MRYKDRIKQIKESLTEGDYITYVDGSSFNVAPLVATAGGVILGHNSLYFDDYAEYLGEYKTGGAELGALIAVIERLERDFNLLAGSKVIIYTDSTYAANSAMKWIENWRHQNYLKPDPNSNGMIKRPNIELCEKIYEYKQKYNLFVFWEKSRKGNEYMDLAHDNAKQLRKELLESNK